MRFKNQIFYIVLSLFLVYAVSPLSYSIEYKPQAEASASIRLLIVDLILSKFKNNNKESHDKPFSVNLLLKKKRAVLSSEKLSKKYIKSFALVASNAIPPKASFVSTIIEDYKPGLKKGFHQSYSGLSPPLV